MPAANVRRWVWVAPSRRDGQTQVGNLCYVGSTEAGQMRGEPFCICLAQQDWQDARSERPAMGVGSPEPPRWTDTG